MNEAIDNLAVNRDANIGGNHTVEGNGHIKHNLRVDGWLEARNIKGPNKGMYRSYSDLRAVYPIPDDGWFALVGDTLPADIYVGRAGEWRPTGEKGGNIEVDMSALNELSGQMAVLSGQIAVLSATANETRQTANEAKKAAESALAAEGELRTVELSALDSMMPDGLDSTGYDEFVKSARGLYIVTDNGYRIGVLEFFCDGAMRHVVTQKLSTHYTIKDGAFDGSHTDAEVGVYWRSYNYSASSAIEHEKGTWGKWSKFEAEPAPSYSVETFYEVSALDGITLLPPSSEELALKPNGNREKNSESNGIVFNTNVNKFQHIIKSETMSNTASVWPMWVTNLGKASADTFGASDEDGIAASRGRLYFCKKDGCLYIRQGASLIKVNQ